MKRKGIFINTVLCILFNSKYFIV